MLEIRSQLIRYQLCQIVSILGKEFVLFQNRTLTNAIVFPVFNKRSINLQVKFGQCLLKSIWVTLEERLKTREHFHYH